MTGDRVSRRGEIHWNDELCSVLERGSVKKRTLRTAHADHESAAALSAVIFRLGPSALDQPAAVLLLLCWTRRVSPTYINLTWLRQCLEWNIRVLRLYDVLLGSTDACSMQHFSLFVHQNWFGEIWHYIICAPLQWMGAVRMRVQTADKNITVIHK